MKQEEQCCQCGDPTGRAGRSEDSIYLDTGPGEPVGPLCVGCLACIRAEIIGREERPACAAQAAEIERLTETVAARDTQIDFLGEEAVETNRRLKSMRDEIVLRDERDTAVAQTLADLEAAGVVFPLVAVNLPEEGIVDVWDHGQQVNLFFGDNINDIDDDDNMIEMLVALVNAVAASREGK